MSRWLKQLESSHPTLWRLLIFLNAVVVLHLLVSMVVEWIPQPYLVGLTLALFAASWAVVYLLAGPLDFKWYYWVFLPTFRFATADHERLLARLVAGILKHTVLRWGSETERFTARLILDSEEFNRKYGFGHKGPECRDEGPEWRDLEPKQLNGIYDARSIFPARQRYLVVRRRDLTTTASMRDAVFSILVLRAAPRLERADGCATLYVDLEGASCAIYDNLGKRFLRQRFLPQRGSKEYQRLAALSENTHHFLMDGRASGQLAVSIPGLRWASGGVLPVVHWCGRTWVCMFFRDIHPLGWNLANGGSESESEYEDLRRLIYREAMEELVVCDSQPQRNGRVRHRVFADPLGLGRGQPPAIELCLLHDELRAEHDLIGFGQTQGPELFSLPAPHVVKVSSGAGRAESLIEEVLLAVNPFELGIEVVRPGRFELGNTEYLLDGEVVEVSGERYLARRPVGLISVDFLRTQFDRNGSLGELVGEGDPDVRDLGVVPNGEFHLFLDDVALREARLSSLEAFPQRHYVEIKRSRKWLRDLAPLFGAANGGQMSDPLTRLLPATWKVLELAFKHGVI